MCQHCYHHHHFDYPNGMYYLPSHRPKIFTSKENLLNSHNNNDCYETTEEIEVKKLSNFLKS